MKKIVLLIVFVCLILVGIGAEVSVRDIKATEIKEGSPYFPLFVGATWKWSARGLGNISELTWEIVSTHVITDPSNDIDEEKAYKLQFKEFMASWYILEHDGFICFYENAGGSAKLERIVPVRPQLGETWSYGNNNYKVVTLEENMVKVELNNERDNRYGYQMFIKDVGPYEIFEYTMVGEEKKDLIMTLIDNTAFDDIYAMTTEEETEPDDTDVVVIENTDDGTDDTSIEVVTVDTPDEKEEEEVVTEEVEVDEEREPVVIIDGEVDDGKTVEKVETVVEEEEDTFVLDDSHFIDSFDKNKQYVQIGAFNVLYYAQTLLAKALDEGYTTKIYHLEGGYYKVVVEIEGNMERAIKKVRKKIAKDAFRIIQK